MSDHMPPRRALKRRRGELDDDNDDDSDEMVRGESIPSSSKRPAIYTNHSKTWLDDPEFASRYSITSDGLSGEHALNRYNQLT